MVATSIAVGLLFVGCAIRDAGVHIAQAIERAAAQKAQP